MTAIYRDGLAGPVPSFPAPLEARITAYLQGTQPVLVAEGLPNATATASRVNRDVA